MSKPKWNLGDVADFMNFHYDDLVEWIITHFVDDEQKKIPYNVASEMADEICDKIQHMGEIQANSNAQSEEAREIVRELLGDNA
jgi:hypothetical protein